MLDYTHEGIKAMADACKARGIVFLLGILPFPPQVSASEWRKGKLRFGFAEDELMLETLYQERLTAFALELGITTIDLLSQFREASAAGHGLYLKFDGHLSPAGHKATAAALWPAVAYAMRSPY